MNSSAELNPDQSSFCIGDSRTSIGLPIRVNQTNPILIELLRIDLETNTNETITITKKEISKLKRQTEKNVGKVDTSGSQRFKFPVKRTGLYRLQKVIDESKLEVQRRLSDTLVVGCPVVLVKPVPSDKCKGELSNFYFQVDATPPLKVKYSKTINRKDHGLAFLSIQSEDLDSPLARQRTSGALVTIDASADIDVSWARTQSTRIPMNETLGTSGGWQYSIEEVHDACGNVANYSKPGLEDFGQYRPSRKSSVEQTFLVHERPKVTLDGHDLQKPLNAPQGKSRQLPVQFSSTGPKEIEGSIYTLTYLFTPQKQVLPSGEHANNATVKTIVIENRRELDINEPGLYTLSSVSTEFCGGEVLEPSSFMLLNPPEPDLTISAENIPDKCAGNSIGLLVDLDLIGTPPFRVSYSIRREGGHVTPKVEKINRLRTQLELRPLDAGHYIYEFVDIGDAVYDIRSLKHNNLILEQDVKPPASARFADWWPPQREACIEEPVTVNIQLTGEAPWTLEYELVHGGSRRKHRVDDIKKEYYGLVTEELTDGGDYTLALTSVTDRSGCKIFLEQELKIEVRRQRPKASFGQLEGKRNILALEARKVKLPLRLIGEPPWTITYRNLDKAKEKISTQVLHHNNDFIEVGEQGTYEIINVKDVICPGTVELSANQFEVRWIPRPTLNVVQSVTVESQGDKYEKKGVCEDDEDAVEISLTGTPPYDVKYEQHLKPDHGSSSMSRKELVAGLGGASLKMETSQSGLYEYSFSELGDYFYDHDRRKSSPVLVQQRVYPRPSARFVGVGKTYSYCKEEDMGAEVLPIALVGVAPFHLDIEIRHHGTTKPNSMSVPNVETNLYNLRIPRRMLALGVHTVTIRKVQDARGCLRKSEFDASHVQVDVADNPSISPVEAQTDYCVGDRISYTLSGTPPFDVFYTFRGVDRKASVSSADFRRIAEFPGDFTIMAISDHKSTDACKARVKITKTIHEMPSVRISKGRVATVDIHEGGKADVLFEFGGTPPFEFTYVAAKISQHWNAS